MGTRRFHSAIGVVVSLIVLSSSGFAQVASGPTINALDGGTVRSDADLKNYLARVFTLMGDKKYEEASTALEQLLAVERDRLKSLPAVPTDIAAPNAQRSIISTISAIELISASVRRDAGHMSDAAWATLVHHILAGPDGEHVAARWTSLAAGHERSDELLTLAEDASSKPFCDVLCHWLLVFNLPNDLPPNQASEWFQRVMKLVAEGKEGPLGVTLTTWWMDKHGEAARADKLLEGWIEAYPNLPTGVTALQLRAQSINPGDDRAAFINQYFKKYMHQRVGAAAAVISAREILRAESVSAALRLINLSDSPASEADNDGSDNEGRLFGLIQRLCADDFPGGLSRPASLGVSAVDPLRVGAAELAMTLRLFEENDAGTGDIPLSSNQSDPITVSSNTLARALQTSAAGAIEPAPTGTKKVVYNDIDPEILTSRLGVFRALSAGLPGTVTPNGLRQLLKAYIIESRENGKSESPYKGLEADAALAPYVHAALFQAAIEKSPPQEASAEHEFEAFLSVHGRLVMPEFAQWAMRRALAAVESSPADNRAAVWDQQFHELQSLGLDVSQPVLTELSAHVQLLKSSPVIGQKILTDLLIVTGPIGLVYKLQEMRIELFAQASDWKSAMAAARLNVAIALATDDGPVSATTRYQSILERAGDQAAADRVGHDPYMWLAREGELKKVGDELAAAAASSKLAEGVTTPSQLPLLESFAGKPEEAFRDAYRDFEEDPTPSTIRVLWFTAARAGDGLFGASYITEWILNGESQIADYPMGAQSLISLLEKKGLTRKTSAVPGAPARAAGGWESQLVAWSKAAFSDNHEEWSAVFTSLSLAQLSGPVGAQPIIEDMIGTVPASKPAPDTTIALLRKASDHVESKSIKRVSSLEIANLLYESGEYDQVNVELNRLDKDAMNELEKEDVRVATLRAMILIKTTQYDEAQRQLKTASTWAGADEDRARIQFLIGWIYLQQEQKSEAVKALSVVTERFGNTTFAAKARELVDQLKSN